MATEKWKENNKDKMRQYRKDYYHRNRESEKARITNRKQELKKWLIEYKSTLSCIKCGQNHPATLDFHHRDSSEKENGIAIAISNLGWSKQKILEEIGKCDVLCANCHRILHWEEKRNSDDC